MANPIEVNAAKVLTALYENNPNGMFDGETVTSLTGLIPEDINDAIEYLSDRDLIERENFLGTHPYDFGLVYLNGKGKYLYHELATPSSWDENKAGELISKQPIAAGSPFGFTDLDWEYVQKELSKTFTLKVVFGYQFKSTFYDPDLLIKNLKEHFLNSVAAYNSKKGVVPIDLNFTPLVAGYGEHLFNQIARDIISADIAVFETSDLNPNVMLEMGVALTWGKRVLPIKTETCPKPPSDISGQTYADYIKNGEKFLSNAHSEALLSMIERAMAKKHAP